MTNTGDFEGFQYFNFETSFLKNEKCLKKIKNRHNRKVGPRTVRWDPRVGPGAGMLGWDSKVGPRVKAEGLVLSI